MLKMVSLSMWPCAMSKRELLCQPARKCMLTKCIFISILKAYQCNPNCSWKKLKLQPLFRSHLQSMCFGHLQRGCVAVPRVRVAGQALVFSPACGATGKALMCGRHWVLKEGAVTIGTVVLVKWMEGEGCEHLLQAFISCICSQLVLSEENKQHAARSSRGTDDFPGTWRRPEALRGDDHCAKTLHKSHQSDLTIFPSTASIADKFAAVRKMRTGKSKVSWGEVSICSIDVFILSQHHFLAFLQLRNVGGDKTFLKIYGFSFDSNGHLMRNKCNTTEYYSVCGRLRGIKQLLLTCVAGVISTGSFAHSHGYPFLPQISLIPFSHCPLLQSFCM